MSGELQICLPRMDTRILKKRPVAIIGEEMFFISKKTRVLIEKGKKKIILAGGKTENTNETYSEGHTCISTDVIDADVHNETSFTCANTDDDFKSEQFISDSLFLEAYIFFREMEKARVKIPSIKVSQIKENVPVVRIQDEVYFITADAKEKIMSSRRYNSRLIREVEKKRDYKNDCNSSSIFFEKEQNTIDRTYFHITNRQTAGENEVYLSGMFVEELP